MSIDVCKCGCCTECPHVAKFPFLLLLFCADTNWTAVTWEPFADMSAQNGTLLA